MIGVKRHGEELIEGVPYFLFYTLNLPVQPFKNDIDVQKDIIDTIDWYKPYRQWLMKTDDIISKDYKEFIYDLGLKLTSLSLLFGCQQGYQGYRHRDIHPRQDWWYEHSYNSAALNYLLTPATGSLDFWDVDQGGETIVTETKTEYEIGIEHDNSKIITSWTGQDNRAPTLIRTEAVHQASNLTGPGPRVVLTLRFELNPIWWMARTAFMPFAINGY